MYLSCSAAEYSNIRPAVASYSFQATHANERSLVRRNIHICILLQRFPGLQILRRGARFRGMYSVLALQGGNVLPFPAVIPLYLPWDFILILIFLGSIIPWRGVVRMQRLLNKTELSASDRLSLYGSTIFFQWLIVGFVAFRAVSRSVSPEELGISANDPWQVAWVGIALTAVLCLNQVMGLRRITKMPADRRGSLFSITEKIMPRGRVETLVYAALSCTAGISEEFLYRGFVFMTFVRLFVNFGAPNLPAAVFSSALFAVAHLYQGRRGLITTFIVGMIFASVRIWTDSLVPAVVAHIGIDLVIGIYASRLFGTP